MPHEITTRAAQDLPKLFQKARGTVLSCAEQRKTRPLGFNIFWQLVSGIVSNSSGSQLHLPLQQTLEPLQLPIGGEVSAFAGLYSEFAELDL
jgi:hypothetical protein